MDDSLFRAFVDEVKERVDITSVVSQHVRLLNGKRGLCPFHSEKTASFYVNQDGQYFHCFGCHEAGDVLTFLMKIQDKSFLEVITELAEHVGIAVPPELAASKEKLDDEAHLRRILNLTAHYYHSRLTLEARQYLVEARGLKDETIERCLLGFADGTLLQHLLHTLNIPLDQCVKAGVLRQIHSGQAVDYFVNRIIIPNLVKGQVVHLSGRAVDGVEPKYLHMPGAIRHLFNSDDAKRPGVVWLEGPFDVMAIRQAGFPAIGTDGTNLREEHRITLMKSPGPIYVCPDGDEAGKVAAIKWAEMLGEVARIVSLPDGLDPNEFLLRNSPEEFKNLLMQSQDLLTHLILQIPTGKTKGEYVDLLKPLLERMASTSPPRREAALSLIKQRFKLTREDIQAYRTSLKQLREKQKEDTQEGHAKPKAPEYTAAFPGLVDIVASGSDTSFLVLENWTLTLKDGIEINDKFFLPPAPEKIPYLLPRGEEVIHHFQRYRNTSAAAIDRELYAAVVEYFKGVSDLPSTEYYDLLALWAFHTFLMEKWQYSPILYLFAVPDRGKSRTGKALLNISYRGVHIESVRDPQLIRLANNLCATLFIDVMDLWQKAERANSGDILLSRFERGAQVFRVLRPDAGPFEDMTLFKVFGPTAVATNVPVDPILETRCLQVVMPDSDRKFENDVVPEGGRELRERLLAFRARHLNGTLPQVEKPADRRLGDILRALMQVLHLVCPDRLDAFKKLIVEFEFNRQERKSESPEGEILKAIYVLEDHVVSGKLKVADITEEVNSSKLERYRTTERSVGRKLTALGFRKAWGPESRRAIVYDKQLLKQICEKYGITIPADPSKGEDEPGEV